MSKLTRLCRDLYYTIRLELHATFSSPLEGVVLPKAKLPWEDSLFEPRCAFCSSLRVAYWEPVPTADPYVMQPHTPLPQCEACHMGWGPDPGGHLLSPTLPDWVASILGAGSSAEYIQRLALAA